MFKPPHRPFTPSDQPVTVGNKIVISVAIFLPFFMLIVLIAWLGLSQFTFQEKLTAGGVFLIMSWISGFGVTLGFHRLFTHRSFETLPAIKIMLAIAGSTALEGPLFTWCYRHCEHHTNSDQAGDPHSPWLFGHDFKAMIKGFCYAHCGWLYVIGTPRSDKYIRHLVSNRSLVVVNRLFPLWVFIGIVLPPLLAYAIVPTLPCLALATLANGARIFFVHHTTWSINSVCHLWGSRPFRTKDESRNNPLFGLLAGGEGWHNTHHAFPKSPRHGLYWWQIDFTWWIIWCLQFFRLAWDAQKNIPTPEEMLNRRTLTY